MISKPTKSHLRIAAVSDFPESTFDEKLKPAEMMRALTALLQDEFGGPLTRVKELYNKSLSGVRGHITTLTRHKLLARAMITSGVTDPSGAITQPGRGRVGVPEPPAKEAQMKTARRKTIVDTILFRVNQEAVRRGRPKKAGKTSRPKLRSVMIKLTEQESDRLETLRRRTAATTSVDTIRAALIAYEALLDAFPEGATQYSKVPKSAYSD